MFSLPSGTSDTDRAFVTEEYRYVASEDDVIRSQNSQAIDREFRTRLAAYHGKAQTGGGAGGVNPNPANGGCGLVVIEEFA